MTTASRTIGVAAAVAFVATVWAANWSLNRWGFVSIGFGLTAPAGVYFAGAAFALRDAVHETIGRLWVVAAIAVGAALAWQIEPNFAKASAAAFLLSELADFAVYTPLRERGRWAAGAFASNIVGATVDSLLFLHIAFASTDGWFDLTVGKTYLALPGVLLVWGVRRAVLR